MDDFSKWLKQESDKEKEEMCKKYKHECYDCPLSDDCDYEELINSIEEW